MASDSLYSHDAVLKRDDPNRKQRAAFARTLRNAAGGPPTDARRAQADAVKAEVYLAIAKFALAIQGTTAQITQRRGNQSLGKIHKALPTPHAHADDEERRPVKSAALRSLFDRPNKRQTLAAFLAVWRTQEMLTGNVLVWANPDRHGRARELFVLPTALCVWQVPTADYPLGAWRVYQPNYGLVGGVFGAGGAFALIPADQVTHHKHLGHPLYHWDGLSPLTGVSEWVDVLRAIDKSCWSGMMRGVRRGLTIVAPGMTPEEAAEQQDRINAGKGGPDNAGDTLVLGSANPGVKPEFHDPDSAREFDYQTSRQNYASLVLAAMGVPPEIAGIKQGGGYAADYAAMKRFRDWTLAPWLAAVAAELTVGVLCTWDDGDDDLKLQLDLPAFHNEEQDETRKGRLASSGITTANMDRLADNLPPWPDPKADELPTSLFLKYLEQKHLPPPAPPPGAPGMPGGDGGGAPEQSADDLLAGLGGGPDSGDAPDPDNPAGEGSLPPQAKAWADWVEKARVRAGEGRHEGEVWEKNGRYFTLKNGRTVPAKKPGADEERSKQRAAARDEKAAAKAGAKGRALDAAKAALADPSSADPAELAKHLATVTVADLRALKKAAKFKGGSLKSELAQKFIDHVKKLAGKQGGAKSGAKDSAGSPHVTDPDLEIDFAADDEQAPKPTPAEDEGGERDIASLIGKDNRPNKGLPPASRPKLENHEALAVYEYTGGVYRELNAALRSGKQPPDPALHKSLQAAFAKVKPFAKPVVAKRGLALSGPQLDAFIAAVRHAESTGESAVIPGYQSTSVTAGDDAHHMGGGVELTINAIHGIDCKPYSQVPDEEELLLPHNSTFRVKAVRATAGGGWVVELDQLPPGGTGSVTVSEKFRGAGGNPKLAQEVADPEDFAM